MRITRGFMADPKHFAIKYEVSTNHAQRISRQPDKHITLRQWNYLADTLTARGVNVGILPPGGPETPDLTFVANAGLKISDNVFVLSSFRHEERMSEIPHLKRLLQDRFELIELGPDEKFEGAGDAFFWRGDVLFIGHGIRTNFKGAQAVTRLVRKIKPQVRVEFLPMRFRVDQGERKEVSYYHRDMCLLPLQNKGMFFLYPSCFEWGAVRALHRYGKLVPANKDQAYNFVCNGIEVDGENIILPWIDEYTVALFTRRFGYKNIHLCPTGEFQKSGGGPQCLFLDIS